MKWNDTSRKGAYSRSLIGVEGPGVGEYEPEVAEQTVGVGVLVTEQVLLHCGQIHWVLYDVKVLL